MFRDVFFLPITTLRTLHPYNRVGGLTLSLAWNLLCPLFDIHGPSSEHPHLFFLYNSKHFKESPESAH